MHRIRKKVACGCLAPALIVAVACGETPAPTFLPAPPDADRSCDEDGFLRTRLYGAVSTEIDWQGADLDCEGMPRPDGRGARLRFAGTVDNGTQDLAFIIALPDLERGRPARELASNVTLIAEGNGRFFSTPGLDSCWADIDVRSVDVDTPERIAISGTLYCIAPIPEVNGSSSVSMEELRFSGHIDWGSQ